MAGEIIIPNIPEPLARVKEIWEWGAWAISAFGAIVALIQSAGGVVGFLTQVALFGFSCYIAAIPVGFVAVAVFSSLDKAAGRQTHDKVVIGFLVLAIIGGGFLVRSMFYDGIGRPGDLDTIGTVFSALVGTVILLTPLYFAWHRYGSKKA
ncbi:hypothetical protein QFZ79_000257 [Arthrobacter sp. V4I6]|uniref:hypothetical protein n=1 Tax=unclassified Arthrobacter TaxID=235627 RepID=UPI00278B303E|nr:MULTISPECIES: hypothetical protein [unclassified Arthrobacter]MDQ0822519.1 hypothetical protein [Arthrobacter sp. V1I7]MDQ0852146.1 hypothetical protein [Arthrobacter sp. V4I6]